MITGVKQGWLDAATYGPAARRAWLGLVAELDADANLRADNSCAMMRVRCVRYISTARTLTFCPFYSLYLYR
jgi:hypothetical protein